MAAGSAISIFVADTVTGLETVVAVLTLRLANGACFLRLSGVLDVAFGRAELTLPSFCVHS